MILACGLTFVMLVAALYGLTSSLATTALIVLGWLAAGLAVGLLLARFR